MGSKSFKLQKFSILQSPEVFKIGTDAMLLGSIAEIENTHHVLEVGTGTGIVSIMLAQRNVKAKIIALDIDEKAVTLATQNVENSPFLDRIYVLHTSLQEFKPEVLFDTIISNPPYFIENDYKHKIYQTARSQSQLPIEYLFEFSSIHLSEKGTLQIIFPYSEFENIKTIAAKHLLFLIKLLKIKGNPTSGFKRMICVFSKLQPKKIEEKELIVEHQRGNFTEEYKELTQDFHVFK